MKITIFLFSLTLFLFSCVQPEDSINEKTVPIKKENNLNSAVAFNETINNCEFIKEVLDYFNKPDSFSCEGLSTLDKRLFFEIIDSSKIKEVCKLRDFVFFKFISPETADTSFEQILKRAHFVIDEEPQSELGWTGTFYKGGGSYVLYDQFLVYHFLSCGMLKTSLEKDQNLPYYLEKKGKNIKYMRLECSYKNLLFYPER